MNNQNQNNDDGIKAVFKGASYAVLQAISKAPYDKTYIGLVVDTNLETNTYDVKIDGYVYENVMSMIKSDINHTVVVMCPQNQLSQMFIYGEIDTTDYTIDETDEETE